MTVVVPILQTVSVQETNCAPEVPVVTPTQIIENVTEVTDLSTDSQCSITPASQTNTPIFPTPSSPQLQTITSSEIQCIDQLSFPSTEATDITTLVSSTLLEENNNVISTPTTAPNQATDTSIIITITPNTNVISASTPASTASSQPESACTDDNKQQ